MSWVASKLLGTAGALGAEAVELCNWIVCFGCVSEELKVVVAKMAAWMANSYPPRFAYCKLMACHLVMLDKSWGVRNI